MDVFDALYDTPEIHHILTKHEQAASFMATGYVMAGEKPAATIATTGPGALNLASGLTTAYQGSNPVLAITGQIPTAHFGRGFIQEPTGWGPRTISQSDVFRAVTKWSVCVPRVEKLPYVLERAYREMVSGRPGPVHVDLPIDIQKSEIEAPIANPRNYTPYSRVRGDGEAIARAAKLFLESSAPSILAGGGAVISGASPELLEIAQLVGAPVATTLNGKSVFPEDHVLAIGVVGTYGHQAANTIITSEQTDVLLAVGCAFSQVSTMDWRTDFGGKRIIQVDIDPAEVAKNYPTEVGIVGDAKHVLADLVGCAKATLARDKKLREELRKRTEERLNEIRKLKQRTKYYEEDETYSESVPIKPQRALKEIRNVLRRDAIVLTDCGNNLSFCERYLQSYIPRTFLVDGWHTHMGFSVAAAIGAKLARPERQVVDVCGDGSFMMLCKELETAVTYDTAAVWCILDDQALGMIRDLQRFLYEGRHIAVDLKHPDFVRLAEAFGAYGERIDKPDDVGPALKKALESAKPGILDIRVDSSAHPGTLKRAEALRK